MLKKILEKLKALANANKQSINPEKFNDPVALATSWSPAKSGGSNFRTHKLRRSKEHYDRLEFVPTIGSWLMGLVFLLIGLGIIIGFSLTLLWTDKVEIPFFIPYIFGGIFTIVGIFIFRMLISKHTFDLDAGYYWVGGKSPDELLYATRDLKPEKAPVKLKDIHAIQIVSEWCRSDKSSYTSYELNLVLNDGSRRNVIDHGNVKKLREDAAELAEYLGVPVWDITLKDK
ncbi:MAG: hypothetical protein JXR78_03980 [Victivallales bacterium]|nr:hypothetical protein [Victivallales bacterium]